jgi:hypothetical protein
LRAIPLPNRRSHRVPDRRHGSSGGSAGHPGQAPVPTTGGPVDAAIVSVFLGQDRIARTLSDRHGGFTLEVPGRGTYRIVAERIGFATDTSAVIEVGADAIIEFEFVLNERAVALDGIDVAAMRDGGWRGRESAVG